MRPIDADTVSAILTRIIEEQTESHHDDEVIGLMEARTEVNNAVTLDMKPVVHAHWIKGVFADITCSNCDFPLCVPDLIIPKLAYCPHCDAIYEAYQKGREDALKEIKK